MTKVAMRARENSYFCIWKSLQAASPSRTVREARECTETVCSEFLSRMGTHGDERRDI